MENHLDIIAPIQPPADFTARIMAAVMRKAREERQTFVRNCLFSRREFTLDEIGASSTGTCKVLTQGEIFSHAI
jgi:hypothetical protein